MRNLIAVLLLLSAICTATSAKSESPHRQPQNVAKQFDAADQELTALYEQLIDVLPQDGRAALVASQQAWVKYRDAEAAFKSLPHKGQAGYALEYTRAMTTETQERIAELREHLKTAPAK